MFANSCHGSIWVALSERRDALLLEVHVEDLDVDLVADRDDRGRVLDVLPAELGDVDQPVHPAEVDERAEVDDRGDHAVAPLARAQVREEVPALLLLGLLEPGAAREDDVVAVAVELDDLGLDDPADVGLQLADPAQLDEGGGQEARAARCRR